MNNMDEINERLKSLSYSERKQFWVEFLQVLSKDWDDDSSFSIGENEVTNVDAFRKGVLEVLVSEIIEKKMNDEELEKEIDYLEKYFGDLFHDLYIESIFERAKKNNK